MSVLEDLVVSYMGKSNLFSIDFYYLFYKREDLKLFLPGIVFRFVITRISDE